MQMDRKRLLTTFLALVMFATLSLQLREEESSDLSLNGRDKRRSRKGYPKESNRQITHGLTNTKLYKRWLNMLSRCYDHYANNYEEYGGRGIRVCDEWFDFSMFYWHVGEVPTGMELDRVDNDWHYCPENVRWVPRQENVENRRRWFKKGRERASYGWWLDLGLKNNPYIVGPMPYKRTSLVWRRKEAIERGWYTPKKQDPKYLAEE